VPADASVEGDGVVDLAFVTGEQAPVGVRRGEVVVAGARVVGAPLRLRVVRPVSHSRLASLWQASSGAHKPLPRLAALSTRFGQAFTLMALGLAMAGFMAWWPEVGTGAQVATAVLIIACPCALTLAAPVTLGTAAGCLGRAGVFLKTPAVAFDLARVDTVVFDKTGTLTQAEAPAIVDLHELDAAQWAIVRQLAGVSTHPVSRALAGSSPVGGDVRHVQERAGAGIVGEVAGIRVALGTAPFVEQVTGRRLSAVAGRTYASVADRAGWLTSTTPARPGATEMIAAVSRLAETWLVSGDHDGTMAHWRPLFSDRQRFQQAPEDKQRFVDQLQADGRHVLMIGDGLNDAAALGSASVGIAVADHAACLVPACDVVVSGEALQWLPEVLQYARRASRVIALCLAVSVLYNLVGLYLALTGALTPLVTAILMPVSSLTIVGLSTGLMRVRVPRPPS
jgi:Cu+-exporting ATPase